MDLGFQLGQTFRKFLLQPMPLFVHLFHFGKTGFNDILAGADLLGKGADAGTIALLGRFDHLLVQPV